MGSIGNPPLRALKLQLFCLDFGFVLDRFPHLVFGFPFHFLLSVLFSDPQPGSELVEHLDGDCFLGSDASEISNINLYCFLCEWCFKHVTNVVTSIKYEKVT